MEWTGLTPIDIADYFGKETKATAKALNERITHLLATRAALDKDSQALEAEAATLGGKAIKRRQDIKARELDALAEEISTREELAAFQRQRAADLTSAAERAGAALGKAETDVRKKLVSIGYIEAPPTTSIVGKITPGMVLTHPDVVAARRRHMYLVNLYREEISPQNKQALERVRNAIAAAK